VIIAEIAKIFKVFRIPKIIKKEKIHTIPVKAVGLDKFSSIVPPIAPPTICDTFYSIT